MSCVLQQERLKPRFAHPVPPPTPLTNVRLHHREPPPFFFLRELRNAPLRRAVGRRSRFCWTSVCTSAPSLRQLKRQKCFTRGGGCRWGRGEPAGTVLLRGARCTTGTAAGCWTSLSRLRCSLIFSPRAFGNSRGVVMRSVWVVVCVFAFVIFPHA